MSRLLHLRHLCISKFMYFPSIFTSVPLPTYSYSTTTFHTTNVYQNVQQTLSVRMYCSTTHKRKQELQFRDRQKLAKPCPCAEHRKCDYRRWHHVSYLERPNRLVSPSTNWRKIKFLWLNCRSCPANSTAVNDEPSSSFVVSAHTSISQ